MEKTNEKVRIQDDLFEYVNGEWIAQAVIPDDKPTTGGFAVLAVEVEKILMGEFEEMSSKNSAPDIYTKNAVSLYRLVKDTERRNAEGITPVLPRLAQIESLKDINDFSDRLPELVKDGMPLPFGIGVDEDMKDSTHYCVMVDGPSVILPDTTYYKPEMAKQKKALMKAWTDMVKEIIALTGLSKAKQSKYIKDAIAFDALLPELVLSREEMSEYTKLYNPMKISRVASFVKPVDFKRLVRELFGEEVETIIVAEPRFFKSFKTVFNADTFELYKHWAYIKVLLGACSGLSEELRELSSRYQRTLTGVKAIPEINKYAYQLASSYFSEPIGLYYGRKYFGEAAKQDVIEMVKEIVETYKNRVARNEILSESTKEKAILKLSTMGLKMAYPDKVDSIYDELKVDESKSLYDNLVCLNRVKRLDRLKKYGTVVDRTKWVMPGHMVNACYNPSLNDITFPAAILQAPFYSIKQTRSQNLGGIGAVIAHEISHAFDNNGAKFDENGNMNNWWTKEDNRRFVARTKAMIKQFDGIELPQGRVNGKFIVSENIADNGGVAATLEVMSKMKEKNYEEYFINWAKVWCLKAKPEYLKLLLSVDVHGPAVLRANMPPRNFTEWYETFNVTKDDKMYIPPAKRVVIW